MSAPRVRGIPLTTFLVALSFGSLFVAISNAMLWHRMVIIFPPWAAYVFAAGSVLRLVAVAGLWLNSRAAALLYVLLSMTVLATSATIGATLLPGLLGSVVALLLIILLWPKWQNMPRVAS